MGDQISLAAHLFVQIFLKPANFGDVTAGWVSTVIAVARATVSAIAPCPSPPQLPLHRRRVRVLALDPVPAHQSCCELVARTSRHWS